MDLIDRQAAIDAIARATFDVTISGRRGFYYYKDEFKKAFVAIRDKYIEALKALPPAEPERKNGRWLETDDGWESTYYVCSECGCPWTLIEGAPEDNGMHFCPNCGANMRGDENG